MNLDDLMEVWQSQEASPLHGVNETLVRLALRQDEAKAKRWLRIGRWILIAVTALIVRDMARFLLVMINSGDEAFSVADYAIPVVGTAAALVWARMMYVRGRAHRLRLQRFGDSLRDQINRQLVQLDYAASGANLAKLMGALWLPIVCAFALILGSWRMHGRSFSDVGLSLPIVFMICWCIACVGGLFWWMRRVVQRKNLPRRRRLEALLKELDGE